MFDVHCTGNVNSKISIFGLHRFRLSFAHRMGQLTSNTQCQTESNGLDASRQKFRVFSRLKWKQRLDELRVCPSSEMRTVNYPNDILCV